MKDNYLHPVRMYDYAAGGYCGVVMPGHVMKKIVKLNAKYSDEVRKVLNDHKDELIASNWALANVIDGGKIKHQVTIKYGIQSEEVISRIGLFQAAKPEYIADFYLVETRAQAQEIAEETLQEMINEIVRVSPCPV